MNWHLAKIVFRIVCGDGNHAPQFDEQLRLIHAADEDEALTKARTLGENEEESFLNNKNQPVQWQFIGVAELYSINAFLDGAELYSRIYETEDASGYIALVNKKAANIAEMKTHKLLHLL